MDIFRRNYSKKVWREGWQNVKHLPQLVLTLPDVLHIRGIRSEQFLGKIVALIEPFATHFDAVLEVVEFVLQQLNKVNKSLSVHSLRQRIKFPLTSKCS